MDNKGLSIRFILIKRNDLNPNSLLISQIYFSECARSHMWTGSIFRNQTSWPSYKILSGKLTPVSVTYWSCHRFRTQQQKNHIYSVLSPLCIRNKAHRNESLKFLLGHYTLYSQTPSNMSLSIHYSIFSMSLPKMRIQSWSEPKHTVTILISKLKCKSQWSKKNK